MKKILLLLICSQIIAQETLNETIVFESKNPFSFEEVINNEGEDEVVPLPIGLSFFWPDL